MQHKHTAQGLASLGRGPDTELVHMTKGEVHGLQKLAMAHGGSLTINPQTGLPEAGFLSSLLPMMIGAGLSVVSGGTLTPMMAAMMTAGGYGVATGSLQKGLMAGLGAYGGAGLGAGLMGAGAAAGAEIGAAGASAMGPQTAVPLGSGLEASLATQGITPTLGATGASMGAQTAAQLGSGFQADVLAQGMPSSAVSPLQVASGTPLVPTATPAPELSFYDKTANNFSQMGRGFTDVTSSGAKALAFAKDNVPALGTIGLAALGGMGSSKLNAPPVSTGMIRPYTFERTQNEVPDALTGRYVPGQSTRERDYFKDRYTAGTPYKAPGPEYMADGGEVAAYKYDPITQTYSGGVSDSAGEVSDSAGEVSDSVGGYTFNPLTGTYGRSPTRALPPAAQAYYSSYSDGSPGDSGGGGGGGDDGSVLAQGGIIALAQGGGSNLGGYSDGGQLLRGPGDGVSDSIPAMIGQKQQARLADGEFVVPARIVSELGNGSTQAGARQLYAMMDRVQNARKKSVGKDKVATNTKARTLLPA